jgi:hypothetical protein
MQYYGAFYRSALHPFLQRINTYLMRWIGKKYKRLKAYHKAKVRWQRITSQYLACSTTGHGTPIRDDQDDKSRMNRQVHLRILWEQGALRCPGHPTNRGWLGQGPGKADW